MSLSDICNTFICVEWLQRNMWLWNCIPSTRQVIRSYLVIGSFVCPCVRLSLSQSCSFSVCNSVLTTYTVQYLKFVLSWSYQIWSLIPSTGVYFSLISHAPGMGWRQMFGLGFYQILNLLPWRLMLVSKTKFLVTFRTVLIYVW